MSGSSSWDFGRELPKEKEAVLLEQMETLVDTEMALDCNHFQKPNGSQLL